MHILKNSSAPLALALLFSAAHAYGGTFYVSNNGSDNNNGTTTTTPWKTIAKVNQELSAKVINSGDSVLFESGGTWREQLTLPYPGVSGLNGTASAPIDFGAYGSGNRPIITGSTALTSWSAVSANSENYLSDANMQGAWLFSDSSGATYADDSGKKNTLAATAKTSSTSIPSGFTGTSANLTTHEATLASTGMSSLLPVHSAAANFTIGGWVNLNALTSWTSFFSLTDGSSKGLMLMPDSGGRFYPVVFTTGSGAVQGSVFPVMTKGVWTHVVIRVTGATGLLEVFFNGVKQLNSLKIPNGTVVPAPSSPLIFGGGNTGLYFQWFAENRALPDNDIISIYANGIPAKAITAYSSFLGSTVPHQVFANNNRLKPYGQIAGLPLNSFFYENSLVYVRTPTDVNPSGKYTIEASQRDYAIYGNCAGYDYFNFTNLQIQMANTAGLYTCGSSYFQLNSVQTLYNYGQGIRFDGGTNNLVENTVAAYNGADGVAFDTVPNLVGNNILAHDNVQLEGNEFSAGIKVEPNYGGNSTTDALIENSTSYNNGVGLQTPFTGSGIWVDTIGNGAQIRKNITYGNNDMGINLDASNYVTAIDNISYGNKIGGIGAYADGQKSMTGHKIVNNTVYGNQGFGIMISGPAAGYAANGCLDNQVADNIATDTLSGPNLLAITGCENPGADGSGNVVEYNDFGPSGGKFIQWGGTLYTLYSAWENAGGNCKSTGCTHSVEFDPRLTNPADGNFALEASSPARGKGLVISGIGQTPDAQGVIDLGAVPYLNP